MRASVVMARPASRTRAITWLIALTPLWLLAVVALASNAVPVVLTGPPIVAGLPLGVVLESLAALWMVGGLAIVWRARSPLAESIALMLFTIPATVVGVLTPAFIQVLRLGAA